MIPTNCAACAAPLAHDAPKCARCKVRYCNRTCQMDHWRRGHKQICKRIHRGGNAEQYNADKKYKEAVAVAVEACAEDTKGQKCYICLEAVHPHTGEGLVRGCACGDRDGVSSPELGVAHVSCLGTRVECNVRRGGWRIGRVVKHWYWEPGMPPGHFVPYQIELDSGCLIFARHDDDRMIRRAID